MDTINAIGRRKASVARVYVRKGTGKFEINGRTLADYFPMPHIQAKVTDPMSTVGLVASEYDVIVNVDGGGFKGQAEAVRLGVSRALVKMDETFKPTLKEKKFLTRDAREVERKKFGKPKARKSFQFSKR